MSEKKKKLLEKAIADFHKHGGGTEVDPHYVMKNPEDLKDQLQASFDSIFPELMKKIRKKIYCFETDTVYKSIKDAAKELGIGSPSNLARYTRQGKPTKGFHFKFIEDKDMTNNNLTGGGLLPS